MASVADRGLLDLPPVIRTKTTEKNPRDTERKRDGQAMRTCHAHPHSPSANISTSTPRNHWFPGSRWYLVCQNRLIATCGSLAGWGA